MSGLNFDDLEDSVLELIFAHACAVPPSRGLRYGSSGGAYANAAGPSYRHSPSIPQVCKRWTEVYTQSTVLWEAVHLDWAAVHRQGLLDGGVHEEHGFAACSFAAKWLARRLPYVRHLVFRGGCSVFPWLSYTKAFPEGLVGVRLREVRLLDAVGNLEYALTLLQQRSGVSSSSSHIGRQQQQQQQASAGLQALRVSCPDRLTGPADPLYLRSSLLEELSFLTALQSLDMFVDKIFGSTAKWGRPLAGLTHLSFRCRLESAALAPDVLEGLSKLRRLELGNVRLAQFTPRLAQALSQLTCLACSDVLAARPRRRAGITLWQGLRHLTALRRLRLEHQSGAGMPANALACTGLQGLTLLDCSVPDWPLLPHRYSGEGGCLGRLQSLHLGSLKLARPIPPLTWRQLAPALTSLTWHQVTRLPEEGEEAHAHAQEMMQAMEVPPELSQLQGLRSLCLQYAQLDAVPAAVQALTQLTYLSLEGNQIASLPAGRYLTGLDWLSLANNRLAELPEGLTACSRLTELSLVDNSQLAVGSEAAEKLAAALPHLQYLRLTLSSGGGGVELGSEASDSHMQGLRRLVQLLGDRLVWQTSGGSGGGGIPAS